MAGYFFRTAVPDDCATGDAALKVAREAAKGWHGVDLEQYRTVPWADPRGRHVTLYEFPMSEWRPVEGDA